MVECGPASNAHAFARACNDAAGPHAPRVSSELSLAFSSWLFARLQQTGKTAAPIGTRTLTLTLALTATLALTLTAIPTLALAQAR